MAERGDRGDREGALRRALARLGGHASAELGLALEDAADRARWLFAARLLSERVSEPTALAAFRRLDAGPGTAPAALARAAVAEVAAALEQGGLRRAEAPARSLCRAARALGGPEGDLEARAAAACDLAELGARLAALAPGFGRATLLRFLRPLREVWSAARETPLAEPASAAAVHLGLLAEGEVPEGEPVSLRRACAELAPDVRWIDVESALERLGARACRAGRSARCPLGPACPARPAADAPLPGLGALE